MNVKVDKQENSKVVLEFTMDKETFEKELDKAFHKNAKYFKVPGFRNGKVPRNVVEKVYGEGVLYETVIEDNVDDEYRKAVEDNKLEVVSKPELDVKQIGKGKDLIYTVTLFVKPEATVKKYKGLEVKKIDSKVSKKEVDAAIESDRQKNARVVSVDDRDLQKDDISTIDFEGFVDGVAFEGGKAENFELTIGSGQFIPGFEDQLIGMKIGEEKIMKTRLTKSEFAVMEVLWDEGEELTSAEIIQKSKEREWKDSSIHLIINSLLRKKVVTVAGFKKTTKNYARTFVPVETREQFLVGQIIDDKTPAEDKKRIYSYIIGKESDPELINYIEELLKERKKELKIKSK